MPDSVLLMAGTKKGLFLLKSNRDRSNWELSGPFLNGNDINHATLDARSHTLYATANNPWFGNNVAASSDFGSTWREGIHSPKFPETAGRSVERLWRIQPGRDSEQGVLFCGVDPGCLFHSQDGGISWTEDEALNNHATRDRWFPGAGGLIVHSIVLDQDERGRMWVAISAAGVFRTDDRGKSWQPANTNLKNIAAKYDSNAEMYPEVGQCVHHLVAAAGNSGRLYAQTHWGTYRSDDGAQTWTDITEGLPSDFGMVMAAHPTDPETAYVLPLQGAEFRCPPEGKLRVYRTNDAGKSWQPMTQGLPQEGAYMGTYREAMTTDSMEPAGVYFATNTGNVYASANAGDSWQRITADLPPVSSLSAAVV